MICLCINNLYEVVVFQCISTLCNISILYYSVWVSTPMWGTGWCHNSLLWSWGCNGREGCILPYSDRSPLGHRTYDGYARGNTLSTLKRVTEVFRDPSFPEGNPAPQIAVHLVNRSAQNIKITVQVWEEWRVEIAQWFCGLPSDTKNFILLNYWNVNIAAWSMGSVCQPSFCPLKIRHLHTYVRRHTQGHFHMFFF